MNDNTRNKLKLLLCRVIDYFIIISFLFPRGYAEFNIVYKNVYTYAIWASTLIIWGQFLFFHFRIKEIIKRDTIIIISYFVSAFIITLLIRGIVVNGYQKLIAYPSICLFTICNLKKNPKRFLNSINNVVMILLILNQVVLREFFSQQLHMTFLGHVQMISQITTLAIFCALIFWVMFKEKKKRTIFIIIMSLFTMITTDASLAKTICVMLCIFAFLYKFKKYNFLTYDSKVYIIIGIIFNVIIILLSVINNVKYNNAIPVLDLSGRSFVWVDALDKIKNKVMMGYGVEGVLLNVFWNKWNNSPGFNYAHNQILQNLLDGGVILCSIFIFMLFSFCKNTKKISNIKYKVIINTILIIFLGIMIFESTSSYCYMYLCFSIIYTVPSLIESKRKGEEINGTY